LCDGREQQQLLLLLLLHENDNSNGSDGTGRQVAATRGPDRRCCLLEGRQGLAGRQFV
jgi:hypothetical protein